MKLPLVYKYIFVILISLLPGVTYPQGLDIKILRSINSPETLPSDKFFLFVTNSQTYVDISVPVVIGAYGFINGDERTKRTFFEMAGASLVTAGITQVFKYTINRKRPFVTYPDIKKKTSAGGPSFPSGHTSAAFATATSLSLAYPKWYVIVPSYAWAGTVGFSRMFLGAHFPSDVLAGAIIGSGCALLAHVVNNKLYERKR